MGSGTLPLEELTGLVRVELDRINRELVSDLHPERPELWTMVQQAASYRGKQLRPVLVCLSGRAVGELSDDHVEVAKVVELLHTATLVHDDVLDGASLRRQQQTINAAHGIEVSVLLGDYIYARAFHMSVGIADPTCSRVLGEVVRRICQGEITQIVHRFDFDWDEPRYFQVITEKTALLYGAACRLGAYYSGGTPEQVEALERFGTELGVAFQIVDDVLDLDGDEGVVGKSLGTDLGKGKLTLPLLRLLRDEHLRLPLRRLMEAKLADEEKLRRLHREFPLERALNESFEVARERVRSAVTALEVLPPSPARDAIQGVAEYVLVRKL